MVTDYISWHNTRTIPNLVQHFGKDTPSDLTGLNALCLCSGGRTPQEETLKKLKEAGISSCWLEGDYPPYTPRIFHDLGIKVTAVDVADMSQEPFESLALDLRYPESLAVFEKNSAHIVTMHNARDVIFPTDRSMVNFAKQFTNQIRRILNSKGIFATNEAGRLMRRITGKHENIFFGQDADISSEELTTEQNRFWALIKDMIGTNHGYQY